MLIKKSNTRGLTFPLKLLQYEQPKQHIFREREKREGRYSKLMWTLLSAASIIKPGWDRTHSVLFFCDEAISLVQHTQYSHHKWDATEAKEKSSSYFRVFSYVIVNICA